MITLNHLIIKLKKHTFVQLVSLEVDSCFHNIKYKRSSTMSVQLIHKYMIFLWNSAPLLMNPALK